jgi:hypothetical protein
VHIEKLHSRNEACENLVLDKLRDADMSGAHVAPKKNQACFSIFRPYQNRICVENFYSFTSKTSRRNALSKPNAIQPLVLKRESIFPAATGTSCASITATVRHLLQGGRTKTKKNKKTKTQNTYIVATVWPHCQPDTVSKTQQLCAHD